jgi:hypothetical protein
LAGNEPDPKHPETASRSALEARDERDGSAEEAREEETYKRVRGKPFDTNRAREAARLSAESRRGRRARSEQDAPTDADIELALRQKAAKGDVQAARELRERARLATPGAGLRAGEGIVSLEDMPTDQLERLRNRLLLMAQRFEARAARGQPGPLRASESTPDDRRGRPGRRRSIGEGA